ncbi:hypothetical protein BGZ90_003912 [Linnemannia elongata]|nr:hypothetical protein BGZ90_003912 [Linnemannia elongata]
MTSTRRVAIVTGSSRGIGRDIALRLAQDGFHVVVNYQSSASRAQEVVNEIEALPAANIAGKPQDGVRAIAFKADIGRLDEGQKLLDETIAVFGRLDIVVLNAAWMVAQSIHELTEDSYLEAFNTNVKGPLFFLKNAQPYLAQAQADQKHLVPVQEGGSPVGGSRIVTISTCLTTLSMVQQDHLTYCATKGALEQITRILAKDKEFGAKGITINTIAPGTIDTEGFRRGKEEALIDFFKSAHPEGRLGNPDDISGVVSFLASDNSKWVNGQTIRVNGALGV